MRSRVIVALIALIIGAACNAESEQPSGQTSQQASTDLAELRKAVEAAHAQTTTAFKTGDAALRASVYTNDALWMPPNEPSLRGNEAIRLNTSEWLIENTVTDFGLTIEDLQVAEDLAVETGTWRVTLQPKKAGAAPISDNGKLINVWKRQADGSWKLFRDMWSSDNPIPAAK